MSEKQKNRRNLQCLVSLVKRHWSLKRLHISAQNAVDCFVLTVIYLSTKIYILVQNVPVGGTNYCLGKAD
jgi:hypothetical protein